MNDEEPSLSLRRFQDWTFVAHCTIEQDFSLYNSVTCAALGMSGELYELQQQDADVLVEAGDVFSYTFLAAALLSCDSGLWLVDAALVDPVLCKQLYVDMRHPKTHELLHEAMIAAGGFAELTKKWAFCGQGLSQKAVEPYLRTVIQCVSGFAALHGISVQAVILTNREKLTKRYPHAVEKANERLR